MYNDNDTECEKAIDRSISTGFMFISTKTFHSVRKAKGFIRIYSSNKIHSTVEEVIFTALTMSLWYK